VIGTSTQESSGHESLARAAHDERTGVRTPYECARAIFPSRNGSRRSLLRYRPCWAAIRETRLKVAKAFGIASVFWLAVNLQAASPRNRVFALVLRTRSLEAHANLHLFFLRIPQPLIHAGRDFADLRILKR